MDYEAGNLRIEGNNYFVQDKRRFVAYSELLFEDKKKCFDFAFGMSYAKEGAHRDSRSGGSIHRTLGEIFINTFQGKMAEYAIYRFLNSRNIDVNEPDISKFSLGKWDSFDLDCQGKHIAIKSTKSYGDLLLLETKDWDEKGNYIPNLTNGTAQYDYTVLVRFYPDGEDIMKKHKLLFQKGNEIPQNIKEILVDKVFNVKWKYDIPGFIYHSELVKLINERKVIPKNAMLNGSTRMDAENYFFQAGNMHSIEETYTRKSFEFDDRDDVRLIRKCPSCGRKLVLRKGPYSTFWGCEGYSSPDKCKYKQPVDNFI